MSQYPSMPLAWGDQTGLRDTLFAEGSHQADSWAAGYAD